MARIKLKLGENEIEIDSRDFYIDNETLPEIIEKVSNLLQENQAKTNYQTNQQESILPQNPQNHYGLENLDDAEAFEPEFNEPKPITGHEIIAKLHILEKNGFFNSPRTVTETVQQLSEHGWSASPLDVSKSLVSMASNQELYKNSEDNRIHYFTQEAITN